MFREDKATPVKVDPTVRARLELFPTPKSFPGMCEPHEWHFHGVKAFTLSFKSAMQNYKGGDMRIHYPCTIEAVEANNIPFTMDALRIALIDTYDINPLMDEAAFVLSERMVARVLKVLGSRSLPVPDGKSVPPSFGR